MFAASLVQLTKYSPSKNAVTFFCKACSVSVRITPPTMSGRSLRKRHPGVSYSTDTKTSDSTKRKRSNDDEASKPQSASSKSHKSGVTLEKSSKPPPAAVSTSTTANQATTLINLLNQNTRPAGPAEPAASKPTSAAPPATFSPRNPFEELLGTLIVSRPIHRTLSHRAIRTLLTPPYALCTPRAILDAGETRVFEALAAAKTLHKDKTAAQVVALAQTCLDKFEVVPGDGNGGGAQTGLDKLRQRAAGSGEELKNILMKEVKGVGKTGAEVFLRRIQRMWGEFWPVVDGTTAEGLQKLGLPVDGQRLRRLVDECWDRLDLTKDGKIRGDEAGGTDDDAQKRGVFVEVLRQAVEVELKRRSK